jgi:hypothetical protein
VWTSCAYAQAIQERLGAAKDPYPHVLYRYDGAGHFLNALVPYEAFSSTQPTDQGDTALANADADARLWPHLLDFLANPIGQTGKFTAPATPPALNTS